MASESEVSWLCGDLPALLDATGSGLKLPAECQSPLQSSRCAEGQPRKNRGEIVLTVSSILGTTASPQGPEVDRLVSGVTEKIRRGATAAQRRRRLVDHRRPAPEHAEIVPEVRLTRRRLVARGGRGVGGTRTARDPRSIASRVTRCDPDDLPVSSGGRETFPRERPMDVETGRTNVRSEGRR